MTQQPTPRRQIRPAPKFHGWHPSAMPLTATLRERLAHKIEILPVSDLRDDLEELLESTSG